MSKYFFTTSFLLVYLFGFYNQIANAKPLKEEYYKDKSIYVYVNSSKAIAYESPSINSPAIGEYQWMDQLRVDPSREVKSLKEWVPVDATPAWKDHRGIPTGWMRSEDLSDLSNFKKVTDCWPIKHIYLEVGDYAADFYFRVDGSGHAREYADEPISNSKSLPYEPLHVYMEKNMVKLVKTKNKYPFDTILIGGYRGENRQFYVYGEPVKKQDFFSDEEMFGCNEMPNIDGRTRPKRKRQPQ